MEKQNRELRGNLGTEIDEKDGIIKGLREALDNLEAINQVLKASNEGEDDGDRKTHLSRLFEESTRLVNKNVELQKEIDRLNRQSEERVRAIREEVDDSGTLLAQFPETLLQPRPSVKSSPSRYNAYRDIAPQLDEFTNRLILLFQESF